MDPTVQLTNYNTVMKIVRAKTDEAKCLTFPMTLLGRETTWFAQLKLRSIDTFKELAFDFTNSFISLKRKMPNPTALFQMTQRVNESLKNFV